MHSESYFNLDAQAENVLPGPPLPAAHSAARVELWRRQEWHDWFRWRLCAQGFDWSKPVWIALLAAGFAALIVYGLRSDRLFITAGGCVLWFTLVNMGFFAYFGLTLPGPPLPLPGPFEPGRRVRAEIGIYPAGYERRKLARVWVRIPALAPLPPGEARVSDEAPWLLELPFTELPADLAGLLKKQETWRIQRADAPLTRALVETLAVTREQIDAGAHPVKVVAWMWDEQSLEAFGRLATREFQKRA